MRTGTFKSTTRGELKLIIHDEDDSTTEVNFLPATEPEECYLTGRRFDDIDEKIRQLQELTEGWN